MTVLMSLTRLCCISARLADSHCYSIGSLAVQITTQARFKYFMTKASLC